MKYDIPGVGQLEVQTIILDLNGTLTVGGNIVYGVKSRIDVLKSHGFRIVLFTGNTRGDAESICDELGIEWREAHTANEKKKLSDEYDHNLCASIGNGLIDKELHENVALSVVVLQSEGLHVKTLLASDLVVPSINDALDLFIDEKRMIASMRG